MSLFKKKTKQPKVKRNVTGRLLLRVAGLVFISIGSILFVVYFITSNIVVGYPSIILLALGITMTKFFWGEGALVTDMIILGEQEEAPALVIKPDVIQFTNILKPEGMPWECINDGKPYYLYIWSKMEKKLMPLMLPDTQYMDPRVYAKRVLQLPAHQRLFTRKPKLGETIQILTLLGVIIVLWLLILTTTG